MLQIITRYKVVSLDLTDVLRLEDSSMSHIFGLEIQTSRVLNLFAFVLGFGK